jgi:hypothetical protein
VAKRISGGGHQARVHSDQMALVMPGWEANPLVRCQKTLKVKLNLNREYQAQVHLDQMALIVVMQGGWTARALANYPEKKVRK